MAYNDDGHRILFLTRTPDCDSEPVEQGKPIWLEFAMTDSGDEGDPTLCGAGESDDASTPGC